MARRCSARLTVLEVVRLASDRQVPTGRVVSSQRDRLKTTELVEFEAWLQSAQAPLDATGAEVVVGYGIPGIEIGRLADSRKADLIVLGRRPRQPEQPLLLGETADAVVRRSARPVLFAPGDAAPFHHIRVAVDGTDRTLTLLNHAGRLAAALGASWSVVTVVQPERADHQTPARIEAALGRLPPSVPRATIVVREGNPIEEILATVDRTRPEMLVIGYRRGGPPKVIGPADIARNLLYAAPSAVLTIPL